MKKIYLLAMGVVVMTGCVPATFKQSQYLQEAVSTIGNADVEEDVSTQTGSTQNTNTTVAPVDSSFQNIAFFYQTVGQFVNGLGTNTVQIGKSTDAVEVHSYDETAVDWMQGMEQLNVYGDPVFSRLSDNSWIMTARSGAEDPRGANVLLYHEASCPMVNDNAVIAIGPSSAEGCKKARALVMGKTSQVFSDAGKNFIFTMIGGEIYLLYLSDAENTVDTLGSVCVVERPVNELTELAPGEATAVSIDGESNKLLLSDTAIAKRRDGTWVLFVKGIEKSNGCQSGTLCELCSRSIYRATSTDLIHWSELEKVVEQGSIPEASITVDGTVMLYWQDFSNACSADNLQLAAIAPISTAYEQTGTFDFSTPQQVHFADEEFETNDTVHYATNGNPVFLPNAQAQADLEACFQK